MFSILDYNIKNAGLVHLKIAGCKVVHINYVCAYHLLEKNYAGCKLCSKYDI